MVSQVSVFKGASKIPSFTHPHAIANLYDYMLSLYEKQQLGHSARWLFLCSTQDCLEQH